MCFAKTTEKCGLTHGDPCVPCRQSGAGRPLHLSTLLSVMCGSQPRASHCMVPACPLHIQDSIHIVGRTKKATTMRSGGWRKDIPGGFSFSQTPETPMRDFCWHLIGHRLKKNLRSEHFYLFRVQFVKSKWGNRYWAGTQQCLTSILLL